MNIFHCCVQKTASQWVRRIFRDPRIVRSSGFQPYYFYQESGEGDARLSSRYVFTEPFPNNTIVTPLYINFESFCTIPKNEEYRAFFVMRDPRDLIVSWYFSIKHSHPLTGKLKEHRNHLNEISLQEGLLSAIESFDQGEYFLLLESWLKAPKIDPNVVLVKFEDLTGKDNLNVLLELFNHCKVTVNVDTLAAVLEDVRFEKLAKRKQGIEDPFSHYRKGIEGDWVNYFDDVVEAKFNEVAGELTYALGYHSTKVDLLKKQLAQTQIYLQQSQITIQDLQQQNKTLQQQQQGHTFQASPNVSTQISDEKIRLSQITNKLNQTTTKLRKANRQVKRLRNVNRRVKRLRNASTQAGKLKKQLYRVKRQLKRSKNRIQAMESSKFWKLRDQWIKFKQLFSGKKAF